MSYIFLNQFAFENKKAGLTDKSITKIFYDIAHLMSLLSKLNYHLIFPNNLSDFNYNNKDIRAILATLERTALIPIAKQLQMPSPFSSNSTESYEDNESVVLGECYTKESKTEVLENFLAHCLHFNTHIVTPYNLISIDEFKEDEVQIECDDQNYKLLNFDLENITNIKEVLEEEISIRITNWAEWKKNILPIYENIMITPNCLSELTCFAFKSMHAERVKNFLNKVNEFIKDKDLSNVDFTQIDNNTSPESETRLNKFKGQLLAKNCRGDKTISNWHTSINKDFRLYFDIDLNLNKVCFIKLTKKIS